MTLTNLLLIKTKKAKKNFAENQFLKILRLFDI